MRRWEQGGSRAKHNSAENEGITKAFFRGSRTKVESKHAPISCPPLQYTSKKQRERTMGKCTRKYTTTHRGEGKRKEGYRVKPGRRKCRQTKLTAARKNSLSSGIKKKKSHLCLRRYKTPRSRRGGKKNTKRGSEEGGGKDTNATDRQTQQGKENGGIN